jgi:uncharacterized protein (TIGR03435 family)
MGRPRQGAGRSLGCHAQKDAADTDGRSIRAQVSQPILEALEKQLGLKVEKRTEMLDVLVIDHIERPTAN